MDKKFKLADSVSMRLIQIFQEAIMTGIDGADLLRQVELETDQDNPETLVLTQRYRQIIKESYEKLEARALELASEAKSGTFSN